MPSKKNINYSKRLFLIIFASYILIAIIPFSFLFANWNQTTQIVTRQAEEASTTIVRQIRNQADNQFDSISQVQSQIYANHLTQALMYTSGSFDGENILRSFNLIQEMQSFKTISDCADMLFVYFTRMNIALTDSTSATPEMLHSVFFEGEISREDFIAQLTTPYPSRNFSSLTGTDGTRYAAFWCSLPTTQNGQTLGNICLLVKENAFVSILDSAREVSDGMAYVFDRNGSLLFQSSQAETLGHLINPTELSRLQQLELNGKTYIAAREISANRDHIYLTLLPIENVLKPVSQLQQNMFLFVAIATVLMMAAALFLSWRTYRPLNNIVEQVDAAATDIQNPPQGAFAYMESGVRHVFDQRKQLQELAQRSQSVMRASFLSHLLNNAYGHDAQSFLTDCEQYGVIMDQPLYCVLVVHVDSSEKYVDPENPEERNSVWFIISDILECLPDMQNTAAVANYERNSLCLILNHNPAEETPVRESVYASAMWIKNVIEREYSAVATVGIGSIEEGYDCIHRSYLNALHALEYRMVQGVSSIINCADIPSSTTNNTYFEYTAEMESRLESHVRGGNYQAVESILDEIFYENFTRNPIPVTLVRCLLFDMTSTAIRLINTLNVQPEIIFGGRDPIEYLGGSKTIDRAQDRFKEVYRALCEHVNSRKRSHNDELRYAVEKYIEQNYTDENLSQQMIADQFGKSANYLSYFFREQTGEKMSSYISSIRINKAKELLSQTDLSVKDVAARTGFGSDLNFIRVFKKLIGETPGQYRKRMQGS